MKTLLITFTLTIFIGYMIFAHSQDSDRAQNFESAKSPREFVLLTIYEPKADIKTRLEGHDLTITYNLDPWMLTKDWGRTVFQQHLKSSIPTTFYKFRDINTITIIATGTFVDIKGRESHGDAMWATFSRDTSESINWNNILSDNLPTLADKYWAHS
jgi:hypothetical protein